MAVFSKMFSYTEEDHNGGSGLLMIGYPDFDAVQGMGAAHDLLEHLTPRTGAAGEAEAFGAILHMRVAGCLESLNGRLLLQSDLAVELLGLIAIHEDGKCQPPEGDMLYDPEVEENFLEFFETLATAEDDDAERPVAAEDRANLKAWVIHGYLLAQDKYPNEWKAAELFYETEELVDRFLKGDRYEGDQVELIVNPEEYSVELKVITGYCDRTGYYMVDGERDPDMIDEEEEDSEDYT